MSFKIIKGFLEGLENPEKPFLGPNYWGLKKMCLILPKSKVGKAFYIFLHELVTIFVLTQYMELYVVRTDIQEILTNLSTSMISTVCVMKANTFVIWQDSWIKVIDYVTDADKFERNNKDQVKEKIIDKYTKYCRRVTYFYWSLVIITLVAVLQMPVIGILSSSVYRDEIQNGTAQFPHILSSWAPFDKNHSPGSWIVVVLQSLLCAYGAFLMGAYDTNMIVIMVFFGGKLELLRERCKEMMGCFGNGISEAEADRLISQMHTIHELLTKNSRLFNSLFSPVMFAYVVMCSITLCASAFILTSSTNAVQKLMMAQILVFLISQLFMFCWHSNDVLQRSQNLSLGPYESEWWAASVRQRKSLLVLLGKFQLSHKFTAGPFTDLTLSTFITILKGAYSYYTILRK